MPFMDKVRIGVVGLGVMGSAHARHLLSGAVERCELAAVCHRDPARTEPFRPARAFATADEMIRSGAVDAVLIATPHTSHASIAIAALEQGLHVLVEKPIAVTKAEALRLLAARRDPRQVVAAMFNVRTWPWWRRLRELVAGGELGEIRRIQWTATAWFRTQAYYDHNAWRGTWAGEGGGVLLNQCPHQLDLLQWIFGMPSRVCGFCRFGQWHAIEVEDDVTAFLEFPLGATGVFIASTGEAPGTSRLEIAAEMGRVVVEDKVIRWRRNAEPMSAFLRTSPQAFESFPAVEDLVIETPTECGNYIEVMRNFADAILDGVPLIAPAEEGLRSLELANAILLSSLEERPVDLPLDAGAWEARLEELRSRSLSIDTA